MTEKLKKLMDGEFVVNLLLWSAFMVFVINVIMATLPALRILPAHVVTGLIGVVLALVKAVPQPAIMLGLAKLISLKTGVKNA